MANKLYPAHHNILPHRFPPILPISYCDPKIRLDNGTWISLWSLKFVRTHVVPETRPWWAAVLEWMRLRNPRFSIVYEFDLPPEPGQPSTLEDFGPGVSDG